MWGNTSSGSNLNQMERRSSRRRRAAGDGRAVRARIGWEVDYPEHALSIVDFFHPFSAESRAHMSAAAVAAECSHEHLVIALTRAALLTTRPELGRDDLNVPIGSAGVQWGGSEHTVWDGTCIAPRNATHRSSMSYLICPLLADAVAQTPLQDPPLASPLFRLRWCHALRVWELSRSMGLAYFLTLRGGLHGLMLSTRSVLA